MYILTTTEHYDGEIVTNVVDVVEKEDDLRVRFENVKKNVCELVKETMEEQDIEGELDEYWDDLRKLYLVSPDDDYKGYVYHIKITKWEDGVGEVIMLEEEEAKV